MFYTDIFSQIKAFMAMSGIRETSESDEKVLDFDDATLQGKDT